MKFTLELYDGIYLVKPLTVETQLGTSPIEIVGEKKLDPGHKIGAIIQAPEGGRGMIDLRLTTDPTNPVRWPLRFKRGDIVVYDRATSVDMPIGRSGAEKMLFVPDGAIFCKFDIADMPELVDPWGNPLTEKPLVVAP